MSTYSYAGRKAAARSAVLGQSRGKLNGRGRAHSGCVPDRTPFRHSLPPVPANHEKSTRHELTGYSCGVFEPSGEKRVVFNRLHSSWPK